MVVASAAFSLAAHLAERPPVWSSEEDDILLCRAVIQETHDVRTFVFSARQPRSFRYEPGQFLTFELEIDGQPINRCYTIASTPTRPDLLSITVKRVPGGPVSNWLHDNLRPGMALRAVGPMGEFSSLRHPAGKYLFLSGGSGITPLMSMARAYYDLALGQDIVFLHSARSPDDLIFRHELELMASRDRHFSFVPVCEGPGTGQPWHGYRGRLQLLMLRLAVPDFMERTVFTCGPAPYMAAVRAMLQSAAFDMQRYHEESFDFGSTEGQLAPEPETLPAAPVAATFKVAFTKSGKTLEVRADQTVLDAARKGGVRLPSSCSKGLCGTCKSKLLEGEVDMKHQGGIRQREIDSGLVLLCCSRPKSDLVVDR
ncbi:Ferredoxin-NADP reductase [Arboricoccus pini]|uniref:Ferredoxin-NADP reductase n=1 Tax=Arboricoccus pini TaxID=1963835 RepID=A0A212PWS3_9PROT|nr:hybrid-cluster NAD(P)-dependent oxidoreductase [Arboricoccus pini]SNB51401.1 Ferredoxin-NADP reductase [Arboricoccus pini]